ncbi:competence protein CoiA [Ornithinibacillus bavariensis]|nr:competence protein CoiA family protein [Ornithinibacillus bavariensis]
MLQAKLKTGKLVTLFHLTRDEIAILRVKENFFCPTCNERVIVKAGNKTIPHFSHVARTHCLSYDKGEGAYHETGKLLLFEWLRRQGISVRLEEYIPEIKQRPDLLICLNRKKVAIEYQCATTTPQEIHSRTKGYQSMGITPIWILGANQFKRIGRNTIKINLFTLQFLHQFNAKFSPTWYFFDSQTSHFIITKNPYLTRNKQAVINITMKKLHQLRFVDLFKASDINLKLLFHEWKKAKYRFRISQPTRPYGSELVWQRWLYEKRMHREHITPLVYLPVASQFLMKTEPWDWQSRICLEIIAPIPIGGRFSLEACETKLPPYQKLPLINASLNPIEEFLQLLVLLHILKELPNKAYVKIAEIKHFDHIEKAILGDAKIIDKICKILSAKYEHDS